MTLKELRTLAGHTQEEAARYLYTTGRTIRREEAGAVAPNQGRVELYRLKMAADEKYLD